MAASAVCPAPGREPSRPCGLPVRSHNLCWGHAKQVQRGRPLAPLRNPDAPALERLSLRVSPAARERARTDPGGARRAIEGWALALNQGQPGRERRQPPWAAREVGKVPKLRLWRCTSCGGVTMRPRVVPGACICGGGLVPGRWRRGSRP